MPGLHLRMAGAGATRQLAEAGLLPRLRCELRRCRPGVRRGWLRQPPLLQLRLRGRLHWRRLGTMLHAENPILLSTDLSVKVTAPPYSWRPLGLQRLRRRLRGVCRQVDDLRRGHVRKRHGTCRLGAAWCHAGSVQHIRLCQCWVLLRLHEGLQRLPGVLVCPGLFRLHGMQGRHVLAFLLRTPHDGFVASADCCTALHGFGSLLSAALHPADACCLCCQQLQRGLVLRSAGLLLDSAADRPVLRWRVHACCGTQSMLRLRSCMLHRRILAGVKRPAVFHPCHGCAADRPSARLMGLALLLHARAAAYARHWIDLTIAVLLVY